MLDGKEQRKNSYEIHKFWSYDLSIPALFQEFCMAPRAMNFKILEKNIFN